MSEIYALNRVPNPLLLTAMLDNMDESIAVFDTQWQYLYINRHAAGRLGKEPSDLQGKCIWDVFPEAMGTSFYKQYHDAMEQQIPIDLEEFYPPYNKWYIIRARPFANCLMVYATDVTHRHEVEELAKRHLQEIESLNARLHRAVQEAHHRVKNNLQVITALVEMQQSESNSTGEGVHLQRIKQHVGALATIHDLLTQQSKFNADPQELDVQDVFAQLLSMLQQTSGNREITAEIDDFALSIAQSTALSLLVSECVSNAIKHATGKIHVTLHCNHRQVQLEVCDNGTGFPHDFDPRIMGNTGMELIQSAARWDLRGEVQFTNRVQGGGCVVVTFAASNETSNSSEFY